MRDLKYTRNANRKFFFFRFHFKLPFLVEIYNKFNININYHSNVYLNVYNTSNVYIYVSKIDAVDVLY